MKFTTTLPLFFVATAILSCSKPASTIPTLDYAANSNVIDIPLTEEVVASVTKQIYNLPDSVLLGFPRIVDISDKYVVANDFKTGKILVFDRATKKLISYFGNHGKGPKEFVMAMCVKLNKVQNQIVVCDYRNKIINYDINGNYITHKTASDIIEIGDFAVSQDTKHYIATTSPSEEKKFNLIIYDNDWNVVKNLLPLSDLQPKNQGFIVLDVLKSYQDQPLFRGSSQDTMFVVNNNLMITPLVTIEQGALKMPDNLITMVGVDKSQYIDNEYGYAIGDYYFSSYQYNNATSFDLWNLKTGKLVSRNTVKTGSNGSRGLKYNNEFIEPKYASGDSFYFIDSDNENDSEFIVTKVKLKQE